MPIRLNSIIHLISTSGCLILIGACSAIASPATPIPAPSPTPIAHNADWTPVQQVIDGVPMVEVPAGCFTMGSDTARRDMRPASSQCVGTFWIDQKLVTNHDFGSDGGYTGANVPHGNLTWFDAVAYCKKRGTRLPTEAEWEYAARGPDNLIYPWGNTFDPTRLIYDQNMANYVPVAVGSRPTGASWVGALDLSGEMFEWVHSLFKPYPYNASDGRESDSDSTGLRVMRGGWQSYIDGATSAINRVRFAPNDRDWHLGFRCAVTSPVIPTATSGKATS